MATVSKWTPFGVSLNVTATSGTVTRTSATQFTVKINVSWATYYSGAQTNYGMTASSGGGSATINKFGTKASSGSGSFTGTYSISGNGSATKTITVTFKNYEEDWQGTVTESATKNVSLSVAVPAWTSYTIKYDANGGTGAPSSQTKWYGQTLKLSTTKPTRTGYTFAGWSLAASGAVAYSAGGNYTSNASTTLYAVWTPVTYTVTYNANGGTGAPSNQTKTYGKTLTLSNTIPTKTDYVFKGWGTSASSTTVSYTAGGSYTGNTNITLYAIWAIGYTKPRITNLVVTRAKWDSSANVYRPNDEGTYILIQFDWATDKDITGIYIEDKKQSDSSWYGGSIKASGTSGSVNVGIKSGASLDFDPDFSYQIRITVSDSSGATVILRTVSSMVLPIDVRVGGKGMAIGKTAETDGLCDIGFMTKFTGGIQNETLIKDTNIDELFTPNTYIGGDGTTYTGTFPSGHSGTFTLNVKSAGSKGQVLQHYVRCSKDDPREYVRHYYGSTWGDWIKLNNPRYLGTVYSATKSVQITTAGIDTRIDGAVITVPAGTYIIMAKATFNTGSSSGTRNNEIRVVGRKSTESSFNQIVRQRVVAGASYFAEMTVCDLFVASTETVLTCQKSSSITESSTASTDIKAIRIL